ncbi:MAG: zinc ribbon domain-containing protein [Candidatus Hadarchaeales archaeon]
MSEEGKTLVCPNCKTPNPPPAQLCSKCGKPLRQPRIQLDLHTKLTLFFSLGGILTGIICGPLSGRMSLLSLAILVFGFYLCYKLSPKLLKFEASQFPGGWSGSNVFKKYFEVFFFLWLVFWILVYTDLLRL